VTARQSEAITAATGMLIRRPVADVFQALVDPAVTTRFWFTHSTGKLESGKHVRWYWEMYDHAADVEVEAIEDHERISMTWPAYEGDSRTTIEWTFRPLSEDTTFVSVKTGGSSATRARSSNRPSTRPKASRSCSRG
jgi:uncharacterized protein YndB with AHSA1/START domain